MKKKGETSTFIKIIVVIFLIILAVLVGFFIFNASEDKKNGGNVIVLENPMKQIVLANTQNGLVNESAVIQEGITEFNAGYINYLLAALGTSKLHKAVGYGNPKIEMSLDEESWNSEFGDEVTIGLGTVEDEDLRIKMSKEEAVRALLSSDIKQFMKDSVKDGKIEIEMVAGKIELFSKGYLEMYKVITGEEANI